MRADAFHPVAVLGAGPAGLATAAALLRRGVACTVLERGGTPAAALRRVDPEMEMLSPTRLSRLRGMEHRPDDPRYLSFRDFVQRLDAFAARMGVEVRTGREVTGVARAAAGYVVRWRGPAGEAGEVAASAVVNATGMIGALRLPPDFASAHAGYRWMHSLDVRTAHLAGVRRLLVVGGGASAAEVLERWLQVRPADGHAWMALRSRLRVLPRTVLGVDGHYLGWLPEHLPAHWLGARGARLPEPMLSAQVPRAIHRGLIETVPAPRGYAGDAVELVDGRRIEADLVVFATGFRYETAHLGALIARDAEGRPLAHACRGTVDPGVWLLGTRFARSFASPYVRGIARDAEHVAKRIAGAR